MDQNIGNTSGGKIDNPKSRSVAASRSIASINSNTLAKRIPPVQRKTNNTGLPNQLKSGIENLSGHSMDDVKVHYNSSKPAQLNAHAYAQGSQIHLGPGQQKHLPHEAWHVVQQKQGRVKPTMQMKSKVNINDDVGLEKEADVMGAKAVQTAVIQKKGNDLTYSFNRKEITQRVHPEHLLQEKSVVQRTIVKSLQEYNREQEARDWDSKLQSLKGYLIKKETGVGTVSGAFMGDIVDSIKNLRKTTDPKKQGLIDKMMGVYNELGVILFNKTTGKEDLTKDSRTKYNTASKLILRLTYLHHLAENVYWGNRSVDDQMDNATRQESANKFPDVVLGWISRISRSIALSPKSGLHKLVLDQRNNRLKNAIASLREISTSLNGLEDNFREPVIFEKMQAEMDRAHAIVSSVADLTRPERGNIRHKEKNLSDVEQRVNEVHESGVSDARNISMIVNSTSGLISINIPSKKVFDTVTKSASNAKKLDELGAGKNKSLTELSTVSSRAGTFDHDMKDTEDFLIKVLQEHIKAYVNHIGAGFKGDEIQVYLIGPKGPCNECAAKLSTWAIKTQNDVNRHIREKLNDGKGSAIPIVGIRVKTKSLEQKSSGMRQKTENIGHTYGSATSKPKVTQKGVRYFSFDVVHNPNKATNVKSPEEYDSGI